MAFNKSKSLLLPDGFPNKVSGMRQTTKQLVLDRRVNEEELDHLRTTHGGDECHEVEGGSVQSHIEFWGEGRR